MHTNYDGILEGADSQALVALDNAIAVADYSNTPKNVATTDLAKRTELRVLLAPATMDMAPVTVLPVLLVLSTELPVLPTHGLLLV